MKEVKNLQVSINHLNLAYEWQKIIVKINQLDQVKIQNENIETFTKNLFK